MCVGFLQEAVSVGVGLVMSMMRAVAFGNGLHGAGFLPVHRLENFSVQKCARVSFKAFNARVSFKGSFKVLFASFIHLGRWDLLISRSSMQTTWDLLLTILKLFFPVLVQVSPCNLLSLVRTRHSSKTVKIQNTSCIYYIYIQGLYCKKN